MHEVRLQVEGMSCAGCQGAVERALRAVPGVISARADIVHKSATVEAAETVTPQALIEAVEHAGYEAELAG